MCLSQRIFLVFYKYSVDVENTIFCPILMNNLDSCHAYFVYLIECTSCALRTYIYLCKQQRYQIMGMDINIKQEFMRKRKLETN